MYRLDRAERDARLLGTDGTSGGLALPEVFRDVLTKLLDESPVAEADLHRVIRKRLGFKQERVLEVWESWGNFCGAILSVLQDGGWAAPAEKKLWYLTPRGIAQEGWQFVVLQDGARRTSRIRVTFHGEKTRIAREALGASREKLEELIFYIEGQKQFHPALKVTLNDLIAVSSDLQKALLESPGNTRKEEERIALIEREKEESPGPGRPLKYGGRKIRGQSDWFREWLRSVAPHIGWFSQADIRRAWNTEHPEAFLTSWKASSFRHIARVWTDEGKLETRRGLGEDGRKNAVEYRIRD